MNPTRPFFSIVVPTRNRAHLLQHALQTALEQSFDDYEIVVSDNNSSDATAEVVKEMAHPRLRYVRTPESLSMPDHWEFALDHARGEFIGYLCDDDALTYDALSRAAAALHENCAKLIVLGWAKYFGPTCADVPMRNSLLVPARRTGLTWKESREVMSRMTHCRVMQDVPLMLNTFCHRKVIDKVRKEAGRVFILAPDYSFALLIQTGVASWLHLDEPLKVYGEFAESIGMSTIRNRGQALQDFLKEFDDDNCLSHAPLKLMLATNGSANVYLLCKRRHAALANFEINWASYFVACWVDIAVLENHGVDVREDREIFWRVLAEQSPDVQRQVKSGVGSFATRMAIRWGCQHSSVGFFRRIGFMIARYRYFEGSKCGFSNLSEAARHVSSINARTAAAPSTMPTRELQTQGSAP